MHCITLVTEHHQCKKKTSSINNTPSSSLCAVPVQITKGSGPHMYQQCQIYLKQITNRKKMILEYRLHIQLLAAFGCIVIFFFFLNILWGPVQAIRAILAPFFLPNEETSLVKKYGTWAFGQCSSSVSRPIVADTSKMDKFAIAKFNGNDFAVWKFQMRAYLRYHELLDVVEETNVVRHIMNMKTAAEMWTRLVTIYEQKNKTSIHILHQKFYNYQMRPGATITEHVAAIEELVRQLEDLNQKPTDEQIITKVLYTLPQQYQHIAAAFDMLPEKEQTMVNLLPRLLKLETMRNGMAEIKNDEEDNSALYTSNGNRGQRQNHQRNRGGPYQNQQRQQSTKQRFSGKCYNCGKTGHRKIDCYKPQNTQNNGQANAASNSGASSAIMYTAETMAVGNVGELWVADSGASKHMTFRRDIITNYREFSASERKPIIVGNNETIYAEGEGDVLITSYVNGQVLEQGMSEVWYVPEIGKNLFSISAASNRGVNALFSKHTLQLFSRGKVVATGQLAKNGLFEMNIRARATAEAMIASAITGDVANCMQIVRDRGTKTLHLKQTAEHLVRNPVHHRRTKHIDVKFHYTRDAYQRGGIDINHVGTTEQLADGYVQETAKP
ncbi:hypothetical protein Zmor_014548 [Zophobas morio]|uniref:CCHC-type domain-containing protein n=1 Tax=Zophobas morio TaxID=2755281 RepID=A0AA38MGJ2_9CUCU|nr:hypothetical protein Zmor_014548 [Zophobas morio]